MALNTTPSYELFFSDCILYTEQQAADSNGIAGREWAEKASSWRLHLMAPPGSAGVPEEQRYTWAVSRGCRRDEAAVCFQALQHVKG